MTQGLRLCGGNLAAELRTLIASLPPRRKNLTQMTLGFSRDDIGTFMGDYLGNKILDADPFQTIDTKAVGQLVKIGVDKGRSRRPNLECGICGEHGGDPKSIEFFNTIGINYVSCSPFRVPIARLAAAQAEIKQNKNA